MAGARGYRSYRGRGSKGKIALAVVLILVIVASVIFIRLQDYLVYDESGRPHLSLPEEDVQQEQPQEQEDVNLVIQETPAQAVRAMEVADTPLTGWDAAMLTGGTYTGHECNAVAVTMKDAAGHVYYDSASAVSGAVHTQSGTAGALAALLGSDTHAIARLSCFHDPIAANSDVEGMGLKNTGGYIFYDGNNSQWLDPAKPAARQYLCSLAKELADMGFDEILLTDVSYPTEGKLNKIAYGDTALEENLAAFLDEMQAALAPYDVTLSVELPAQVITQGSDASSGLTLAQVAPRVDRIYAAASAADAASLADRVSQAAADTDFAVELTATDTPPQEGGWLLPLQGGASS